MWLTLLLVSSWPFWLILFIFLCSELFIIEQKEDAWLATISGLIFLTLVLMFTDWQPWHSITFEQLITWGFVYLVLGAVYALIPRWYIYVKDKSKAFEVKYKFLKKKWDVAPDTVPGSAGTKYKTFEELLRAEEKMPPMPWDHGVKGKLYMWMLYWPISGTWMLIHKPAEIIFDWAYDYAKTTMAAISHAIFKSHFKGK